MQKLVGILTLTTLGFASSTLYLAYELYSRDAAPASGLASIVDPAASVGQGQDRVTQGTASDSSASDKPSSQATTQAAVPSAPATTPTGPGPTKKNETSDATLVWARPFLARFDDSVQHGEMLNEAKTGIRRQYSRLKEQLNLSDARFEQLVTQLAEEMLQAQEQYARCAVNPECNPNDPSRRSAYPDHSQEYLALLGANDIEAFNQFRSSIGERDQVIQLRGRLPDNNFLPESQAEQLISALAAERELYQQESTQRGATLRGWGTQLGMVYYSQDSGSPDQQFAEATQYSQRMRARAAGVLTPAQLAAYAQMQDELLAQLATMLRPAPAPRKASPSTHAS